ncbi:MAG: efflux RND transporter periplasmic adaptor subunit [Phycisphaerae bacterium]|nr:efflux RND transporter periplasmic adaptor subunit [Phycisphaerae bacterium]
MKCQVFHVAPAPWCLPLACVLAVLALVAPCSWAQFDATTRAPVDALLSFGIEGRLAEVRVRAGQQVKAGEVVAVLDDQAHQRRLQAAQRIAESDVGVRLAQKELDLARLEEERRKQAENKPAIQEATLLREIAELAFEATWQKRESAKQKLQHLKAEARAYLLTAPAAGMIEQVRLSVGEHVVAGDPVVRLIRRDALWVDVAVPTEKTAELKKTSPAWVKLKTSGRHSPVRGAIIYLSSVVDATTDTRVVRVEVPNGAGWLVGAFVTVSFQEPSEPAPPG